MILIKPDHDRRVPIPGIPGPVLRPVDIDQAKTGFTNLRTLRIYQFDQDTVVAGDAEEDEVFIVLLAGSAELTVIEEHPSLDSPGTVTLSAPDGAESVSCAAYLPPGASYQLVPKTDADIAYARATPFGTRCTGIFSSTRAAGPGVNVVLEETTHAERLRLRLVQVDALRDDVLFAPMPASGAPCEGLVHSRVPAAAIQGSDAPPSQLDPWDTVAVAPGDQLNLSFRKGSSGLVLLVEAT